MCAPAAPCSVRLSQFSNNAASNMRLALSALKVRPTQYSLHIKGTELSYCQQGCPHCFEASAVNVPCLLVQSRALSISSVVLLAPICPSPSSVSFSFANLSCFICVLCLPSCLQSHRTLLCFLLAQSMLATLLPVFSQTFLCLLFSCAVCIYLMYHPPRFSCALVSNHTTQLLY